MEIIDWNKYRQQVTASQNEAIAKGVKGADLNAHLQVDMIACLVARINQDVSVAIDERVKAVEDRLGAVEERGLKYCGVHQRAMDYERGSVVTHRGALWIALRPTTEAPGTGDGWQLAVKAAEK